MTASAKAPAGGVPARSRGAGEKRGLFRHGRNFPRARGRACPRRSVERMGCIMAADTPFMTVAVPKGRILSPLMEVLEGAGVSCAALRAAARRLVVTDEAEKMRFILSKPADV